MPPNIDTFGINIFLSISKTSLVYDVDAVPDFVNHECRGLGPTKEGVAYERVHVLLAGKEWLTLWSCTLLVIMD